MTLKLWICEPCTLHDRATVRYCAEAPTTPCPHYGTTSSACKRVGWVLRSWYCLGCWRRHRGVNTPVIRSDDRPTEPCDRGHVEWAEMQLSVWVRSRAGVAA